MVDDSQQTRIVLYLKRRGNQGKWEETRIICLIGVLFKENSAYCQQNKSF